jgi:predicted RNA binding protein YcfA (HicA-like mRNA interferase family)
LALYLATLDELGKEIPEEKDIDAQCGFLSSLNMFARLPGVRAKDLLKALEQAWFDVIRQKGSHITLHNFQTNRIALIPMHSGEFPRWLLKKIIKDAGLTKDQFRHFL